MSSRFQNSPLSALRSSVALMLVASTTFVATLSAGPLPVSAGNPGQANNGACDYNGTLIVPAVDASHPFGWGFVANFDHARSTSAVTTCLAERFYGQTPAQTRYTVAEHCRILNTANPVPIGDGYARFDGNTVLLCNLPVPVTYPDLFWIRANANFPNASQSYTLLESNEASFTASTSATCQLTLNSRYGVFSFNHSETSSCGKFIDIGSRLKRETQTSFSGAHKFGKNIRGPVMTQNGFSVPANYTFTIGAAGQSFVLDWFVIDPVPSRCCSPG